MLSTSVGWTGGRMPMERMRYEELYDAKEVGYFFLFLVVIAVF